MIPNLLKNQAFSIITKKEASHHFFFDATASLCYCRDIIRGENPKGRERKMRGSGGASNSERVKPPEGGGADRQTCQRQGCKAPYAPPKVPYSNFCR